MRRNFSKGACILHAELLKYKRARPKRPVFENASKEQTIAQYDYLIVGAGLFGCVFAHEANKAGKRCLVIERRAHIGGNAYTERLDGIDIHCYGAHIFHTSD